MGVRLLNDGDYIGIADSITVNYNNEHETYEPFSEPVVTDQTIEVDIHGMILHGQNLKYGIRSEEGIHWCKDEKEARAIFNFLRSSFNNGKGYELISEPVTSITVLDTIESNEYDGHPGFLSSGSDYANAPVGTRVRHLGLANDYWEKRGTDKWVTSAGGYAESANGGVKISDGALRKVLRWGFEGHDDHVHWAPGDN